MNLSLETHMSQDLEFSQKSPLNSLYKQPFLKPLIPEIPYKINEISSIKFLFF